MGVDQHAQHAKRFVVFDETHPAHVGGEIVNKIDIRHRALATFLLAKIELQIFRFRKHLKPFRERFHIDRPDGFTLAKEIGHEMAADETASAANYDFFRFMLQLSARMSPALYRESASVQPVANYTPGPAQLWGAPKSESRRR